VDFELAVNNFGDTRSGGLAGPMGLFIIVLMSIATVLLIRNMNKRLRRLPDSFPDPAAARREAEITRLNADLERPDATAGRPGAGPAASDVEPAAVEPEVSAVETSDGKPATDGSAERA